MRVRVGLGLGLGVSTADLHCRADVQRVFREARTEGGAEAEAEAEAAASDQDPAAATDESDLIFGLRSSTTLARRVSTVRCSENRNKS